MSCFASLLLLLSDLFLTHSIQTSDDGSEALTNIQKTTKFDLYYLNTDPMEQNLMYSTSDIKKYIKYPQKSPLQKYDNINNKFTIDGILWKNLSKDTTKLHHSFNAVVSLAVWYEINGPNIENIHEDYKRCSAVFISQRRLLTAKHCVKKCWCYDTRKQEKQACDKDLMCSGDSVYSYDFIFARICVENSKFCGGSLRYSIEVEVIDRSLKYDLAVLEIVSTGNHYVKKDGKKVIVKNKNFKSSYYFTYYRNDVKINDEVIIIGHPMVLRNKRSLSDFTDDITLFFGNGSEVKSIGIGKVINSCTNDYLCSHNCPVWSGSSGGTMVIVGNEDIIVGIHVNNNTFYSMGNSYIRQWIPKPLKKEV